MKDKIRLTVRGHTDSSGVSMAHSKFKDNWELSVLRATQVLKKFIGLGFDQKNLSAEGLANTQVIEIGSAMQRRVTFRVEVRS